MKSLIYIIGIVLFVITAQSCDFNQIDGNGKIIEKVIEISDYSNLKIAGTGDIIYEQKQDTLPYLQIETDENILPLLDIKSEDGKLTIKPVEGNSINPTKLIIRTNSKALASLDMAGSTTFQSNGAMETGSFSIQMAGSATFQSNGTLKTESVSIQTAGSSTIKTDSIISNNIKINTAGSGNVNLRGKAETIQCKVAGSADINILDLIAENVKCEVAGSADIKTYAEKTLNIKVAGSGKISYKGSPEITKSIAGSGDIINLN